MGVVLREEWLLINYHFVRQVEGSTSYSLGTTFNDGTCILFETHVSKFEERI